MNEGMMTGRRINRFPGFIHAEFAQGNRRRKKNPAFTTPASEEGGEDRVGPAALGVVAVPGTEPPWMDHHPRSCISKDFRGLQNLLRFQLGDRCCPFRSGIRYGMF